MASSLFMTGFMGFTFLTFCRGPANLLDDNVVLVYKVDYGAWIPHLSRRV